MLFIYYNRINNCCKQAKRQEFCRKNTQEQKKKKKKKSALFWTWSESNYHLTELTFKKPTITNKPSLTWETKENILVVVIVLYLDIHSVSVLGQLVEKDLISMQWLPKMGYMTKTDWLIGESNCSEDNVLVD